MNTKYRIVEIHKDDAFYEDREEIVGKIGWFNQDENQEGVPDGFLAGEFEDDYYFMAVKVELV